MRYVFTLLIITLYFASFHALAESSCERIFNPGQPRQQTLESAKAWTGFSAAQNYNSAQFIFIVTGVAKYHIDPTLWRDTNTWVQKLKDVYGKLSENNLYYSISASVINESYTGTYGPTGFVLDVPIKNIFSATVGDMGLPNNMEAVGLANRAQVETMRSAKFDQFGLPSPKEIVDKSIQEEAPYNEVALAQFRGENEKVRIVGIFVKTNTDPSVKEAAQKVALTLGLPLLVIPSLNGAN